MVTCKSNNGESQSKSVTSSQKKNSKHAEGTPVITSWLNSYPSKEITTITTTTTAAKFIFSSPVKLYLSPILSLYHRLKIKLN